MLGQKRRCGESVVPQNSVSTFKHRSLQNSANTAQCPHCENMAKNFLYLESLIRNNFNPKVPCKLCFSSLKYLQFVNNSIMEVFGSNDAIVNAAKAFFSPTTAGIPANVPYPLPSHLVSDMKLKKNKRMGAGMSSTRVRRSSDLIQKTAAANSYQYCVNPLSGSSTRPKVHSKKTHSSKRLVRRPSVIMRKQRLNTTVDMRMKHSAKNKKK